MVPGLLAQVTPSLLSVESLGVKLKFTNHIFFRTSVVVSCRGIIYEGVRCKREYTVVSSSMYFWKLFFL